MSQREREARRRQYRRRQRLTLLAVLLVLVLLIVGVVAVVRHIAEGSDDPNTPTTGDSNASQTTTTTTRYPLMAEGMLPGIGLDTNTIHAVMLYDATAGQPVYAYDADRRMYPASMTKMMTAAVACEYLNETASYTIGSEQALVPDDASRAGLYPGSSVSLKCLLEGLLMNSGGDAAYALAVNAARAATGDTAMNDAAAVAKFMELVNARMKQLGCTGSHFTTPDGYYDHDHYATAEDMVKIAIHARSFPLVKTVMGQWNGEFFETNTNLLLNSASKYYYEYADGLKTGYHDQGGYCLAASATKGDTTLIAIIQCGHSETERFAVAKSLFEQGFAHIEKQK